MYSKSCRGTSPLLFWKHQRFFDPDVNMNIIAGHILNEVCLQETIGLLFFYENSAIIFVHQVSKI